MSSLKRPDNRLYFGRGGSGKTTLALQHAGEFPRVLLVRPDDSERLPARYSVTRDPAQLIQLMMAPSWRVAFLCDGAPEAWEWCNEAAFRAGDVCVIWEEAHQWMDGRRLRSFAPHGHTLWMLGRHARCRVFGCSMRPAGVSRDCTANLARAVIFNTTEPSDLKFYRSMIPDAEAARAIPRLDYDRHEALDWSPRGWSVKRAPFA